MGTFHEPSHAAASLLFTGMLVALLSTAMRIDGQENDVSKQEDQESEVFGFTDDSAWPSIDDRVMGGVSQSRMTVRDGVARFEGTLSYEQNGGFTSVRSSPGQHDLGAFDGLALRIRGDGRTYDLRLRTDASFDGVSYRARFTPPADGRWQVVHLPFTAFAPVFRGRSVPRFPALDPAALRSFGLLLADGPAGAFWLEIDWIRAVSTGGADDR